MTNIELFKKLYFGNKVMKTFGWEVSCKIKIDGNICTKIHLISVVFKSKPSFQVQINFFCPRNMIFPIFLSKHIAH